VVTGDLGVVVGDIPAARLHALTTMVPGLTHGEGALESQFHHYEPVRGPLPRKLVANAASTRHN
jgi:ribosomal protection tetracycline resistance protein